MDCRSLFLHWGPGSNAQIERLWYGNDLPIEWWDQPTQFTNPETAFSEIVAAACTRLESLAAQQGKTRLIAHSFGGQIALQLLIRRPELIKQITLLACGAHPCRSFLHLAEQLLNTKLGSQDPERFKALSESLTLANQQLSSASFWPLVQQIAAIPDFMNLYWSDESARLKYVRFATHAQSIDMAAFAAVMQNFLTGDPFPVGFQSTQTIPVRYIFGDADPLLDFSEETKFWKEQIPWITFERIAAGHFIQFEREPNEWAE